jgi:hypothetical protein
MDRIKFLGMVIGIVVVGLMGNWVYGITYPDDYTSIKNSTNPMAPFNSVADPLILDGVTATGAGDGFTIDGQNQHTVYVYVQSGTATVTFQCSPNAGADWTTMATIAGGDSYHFNYNADQCRGNVTACSSCDVDMHLKSIVR